MMRRNVGAIASLALCVACDDHRKLSTEQSSADLLTGGGAGAGVVFVGSNAADGNAVLVFRRDGDGPLTFEGAVPTGGLGTGSGLGNQGGLELAAGDRLLFVVNAGSDQISGFLVNGTTLDLAGTVGSGGDLPISLSAHGDLLYVLNDGTAPNVTGFRIGNDGEVTPIAGSTRALSSPAPDGAQVGFSPDGSRLVVTEKATNQLLTFPVLGNGTLGDPVVQASAGMTPFGFGFDKRGVLIVSEAFGGGADASALSSYQADGTGWAAVTASAATTETAACWVVTTPNGRFVYTTNTGSASISGFEIGPTGALTLLNPDGVTGSTGSTPIDLDISHNGRYLYSLNAGAHSISGFRIAGNGALTPLGNTAGLPASANGLVAR